MSVYGIIPCRYASSRFPGKPLALILGEPMFLHVVRRALSCPQLDRVLLATDDERIFRAARDHGVEAVMTSPAHASGTDRVLEAAELTGAGDEDVVVNIQGDEPALDPRMLSELLAPFSSPQTRVATLARPITQEEAKNPDLVKVVWTEQAGALYFSRSPIPFQRDDAAGSLAEIPIYWGHIGLYAFRMEALRRFHLLAPGRLELLEKLEQLRLLENAVSIRVVPTTYSCHGVDRPEDIEAAAKLLATLFIDTQGV